MNLGLGRKSLNDWFGYLGNSLGVSLELRLMKKSLLEEKSLLLQVFMKG
jgi:hypothetical protein